MGVACSLEGLYRVYVRGMKGEACVGRRVCVAEEGVVA